MQDLPLYLPGILLSYTIFMIGMISPGPNILSVMGTSMNDGRRAGTALAIGIAVGSLTWAILTVAGLTALLQTYANALIAIKIAGGCYLLWLAFKAFKSAAQTHDIAMLQLSGGLRSPLSYAIRGYTIQMTNPKAALSWMAIISLGLQQGAPLWVALVIVGGTFIMSMVFHILYAVAFSTQTAVRVYSRARRKIQATLGVFFTFAGIKLLASR